MSRIELVSGNPTTDKVGNPTKDKVGNPTQDYIISR